MNTKFQKCLQKGLIKTFSNGEVLVKKELEGAKLDLGSAKKSFTEKNYKWATIQLYYSMFHSARALLYAKNYREKSHACLIEAIRNFYTQKGEIGFWLIEALQKAKTLREEADYHGEFTKEQAQDLLKNAKEILARSKQLLNDK